MTDFGNIFSELRKSKNYTQAEVAKVLGGSSSTIAMWESGQRTPTRKLYEAISDTFNVDLDYLYGKTDIKRRVFFDEFGTGYQPMNFILTESENYIIETYRSLPEDRQKAISKYVREQSILHKAEGGTS